MSKTLILPRSMRLSQQRDFHRIFQGRWSASDRHLIVFVAPNEVGHVRLGVQVGRRFGKAVRRNRAKRLIREAFRLEQGGLPTGFDLVCNPRPGQLGDLATYRRSIPVLARAAVKRWRRAVESSAETGRD